MRAPSLRDIINAVDGLSKAETEPLVEKVHQKSPLHKPVEKKEALNEFHSTVRMMRKAEQENPKPKEVKEIISDSLVRLPRSTARHIVERLEALKEASENAFLDVLPDLARDMQRMFVNDHAMRNEAFKNAKALLDDALAKADNAAFEDASIDEIQKHIDEEISRISKSEPLPEPLEWKIVEILGEQSSVYNALLPQQVGEIARMMKHLMVKIDRTQANEITSALRDIRSASYDDFTRVSYAVTAALIVATSLNSPTECKKLLGRVLGVLKDK